MDTTNNVSMDQIAVVLLTLERCVPKHMSLSEALQRAFEAGKIAGHLEGLDRGYEIGARKAVANTLDGFRQDIEGILKWST